jgi:hypothetical protein
MEEESMRTRYTVGQIEVVRQALRKVRPTDRKLQQMSKQSAIAALAGEIRQMRRKGHTLADVAAFLSEKGVHVTTDTLKNYLYRLKKRERP